MAEPRSHFLEGKRIIVAGAGLAGLAFVTGLRKQWDPTLKFPEVTIYDRDAKDTATSRQGFSLSLAGYDETGGLYALKQLGLLDDILPHVILGLDGRGGFNMWDSNFSKIMSVRFKPAKGLPSSGIRIARKDLRKVLIDAGGSSVTWGTACKSARRLDNGKLAVTIERQDTKETVEEECDLLISADGANSRLRASLRPNDGLNYLGAVQMGGSAKFEEGLPSPIDQNWGMSVSGQGIACFVSPVDQKSLVWALSRVEDERVPVNDKSSNEQRQEVLEESLRLGHMFAEPFPTIVRATEVDTVFAQPAKGKEPFTHDASTGGPVVFLGDANHVVSPFGGYGASLALKDGWDLAEQLCNAQNLENALRTYDEISVPRAKKALDTAQSRVSSFHSTGLRFFFFRLSLTIIGLILRISGQS